MANVSVRLVAESEARRGSEARASLNRICSSSYYRVLQPVFDLLAVILSWYATIYLRLALNPFFAVKLELQTLLDIAPPLYGVILLWAAAALWLRLYRSGPGLSVGTSLLRVTESVIMAGVLTVVVTFFSRTLGAEFSRSFVLLFTPVCFVTMMASRYGALLCSFAIENRWPLTDRVAVIGAGSEARLLAERIRTSSDGASFAGFILPESASELDEDHQPKSILGNTKMLGEAINHSKLRRIIVVERNLADDELARCMSVAKRMGVIVTRIVGLPEPDARLQISELYGLRLLELKPAEFTRKQEVVKRTFDVLCSSILLVLLAPLLALIAFLIKVTSKGPVLYCSTRVGKGGRHFTFLKFRSMRVGLENRQTVAHMNEKAGHIFKLRNDPRVTAVGRVLRRWSLDELPQLVNVLIGDMSLVGPRPLPARDLDPDGQSKEFATWAEQRSRVLPGITGLWQVRGRSDLPFDQMVMLDVNYIRDWSLSLDFRILLETPLVMLTGRGAY
jgi:exopolysaccharide biosynthesis polyprenyl glycosylphosphotransferase